MATEKKLQARIKLVDNFTKPMEKAIKKANEMGNTHRKLAKTLGKPINLIFKLDNKIHRYISRVKSEYNRLKSTFKEYVTVKINSNKAIGAIRTVKRQLSALSRLKTVVAIKDKVSPVLNKVKGSLRSISGKVYSFTVSAKDKASNVLNSIKGKAIALGSVVIGGGVTMGAKGLAEEETQKITINRVIENSGKSKEQAKKSTQEYYKYLEDYANKTPFTTQEITNFGTKGMLMSKGNVDNAKAYTDAMANVKAFVGTNRTALEVSDAFFSAQNGNMESLNNMLGTSYKSFDEAMKGIAKNQGGLVDELSQTTGGLFSTIVGKAMNGAKNFVKAFEEPLKNGLKGVISFIDVASVGMVNFATRLSNIDFAGLFASFDFSAMFSAFQPVVNLMNSFFTGIETKSPVTMGIMQVLGSVWNVVWNGIGAVINAVSPFIESIMRFIGKHGEEISNIINTLGSIWSAVWKTVGTLLQGAWKICEPILSFLLRSLSKVSGVVQDICTWWNKMVDLLKTPINAVVNVSKKIFGGGKDKDGGRSAFGTNRVPRNDMPYRLHQGERVLTKREANQMDRGMGRYGGQGVTVQVNGLTVREEADVKRIARQIVKEMNKSLMGGMA